jgi:hypothetical protein
MTYLKEEPKGLIDQLWGLGKHLWVGVDADSYVDDLRKDWDEEAATREERV